MQAKQELQSLLRKVLHKEAGVREPKQFSPVRDWAIGVLCAMCVVGAAVIWSAQQYVQNRSINSVDAEIPTKVVYRSQLVAEVQRLYRDYGARRAELMVAPPVIESSASTTVATTTIDSDTVTTTTTEITPETESDSPFELSF